MVKKGQNARLIDDHRNPRQVVTFEELLRAMMFETEATRRVLVRKGLLTNEEVLEEIKAVRREMGGENGGGDQDNTGKGRHQS
jgi:hypothetical protein